MIRLKPTPLLLLLALSSPAPALQLLDAKDGDTVLAKISQKEVTRIAFEKSRIRKVTGNAGEFLLEKDDERGQVFLRPAQADSTKPINIFVSTDHATIALLLQPVDGPSDTLLIRERAPLAPAARQSRAPPHVRGIKQLLLALASEGTHQEFEVHDHRKALALWPGVSLTLTRSVLGAGTVGEQYQLSNDGSADLTLHERDLYKTGVMAVSLQQRRLAPGETATLYVIRERTRHD